MFNLVNTIASKVTDAVMNKAAKMNTEKNWQTLRRVRRCTIITRLATAPIAAFDTQELDEHAARAACLQDEMDNIISKNQEDINAIVDADTKRPQFDDFDTAFKQEPPAVEIKETIKVVNAKVDEAISQGDSIESPQGQHRIAPGDSIESLQGQRKTRTPGRE